MEEIKQVDTKVTPNAPKSIESELKDHLDKIEWENADEKTNKITPDVENLKPIVINPRVLDFLQDKPVALFDFVLFELKRATKNERQEVSKLFPVSDSLRKLSREEVEKLLIIVLRSNPELEKYFVGEFFIIVELTARGWEMSNCLDLIRERESEKEKIAKKAALNG